MKPILINENKKKRVKWVLARFQSQTKQFSDMYVYVHVDEKWFYLTEKCTTFYLAKHEPEPERMGSKNYMLRVMFLCVVARPRFDEDGSCSFDGKLSIWPFTDQVVAKRSSCNRPSGNLETKCISVSREV